MMHGSLVNVAKLKMKKVTQIPQTITVYLFSQYFIWIICFIHLSIHSLCQKSSYPVSNFQVCRRKT